MGRNRTDKRQAAAPAPEFSAAGRKVLEIHELLYCICTHVDIETLFNAQRVSKRWHQIISTSSVLQQNLYLQSCPSSDLKQERVFNPLLLKHFEPILRRGEKYHFDEGCLDYSSLTVPGMSMTRMKGGRKVHKAFVRCGASWRRMLVAQPPITAIGYGVDVNDEEQDCRVLRFPDGLRMGVLYDMVFQAIFLNPVEAERHCYLELYVPPYGSSNVAIKEMTEKLGQRPGLLFTTASNYYENLAREITSGDFSIPELAVKSDYLCAMKESVRGRKGTRWMFQCEEFEETDYLSLGIEFLKKQA